MGIVGKIVMLTLCLNMATLLMGYVMPGLAGTSSPYIYNDYTHASESLQSNITGFSTDNSASSLLIRIFDFLTLGFLKTIITFFDSVFFSFVNILVQAGIIGPEISWFASVLKVLLGILYGIYGVELITGRRLDEN